MDLNTTVVASLPPLREIQNSAWLINGGALHFFVLVLAYFDPPTCVIPRGLSFRHDTAHAMKSNLD